jgi:hypothetical protein
MNETSRRKKAMARKKVVRRARARRTETQRAAARLSRTWDDTREAIGAAEVTVEKRLRALVKKSGLDTRKATKAFGAWRERVERERRRAMKRFDAQVGALQTRAKRERKAIGRTVDEAVQGALAALNIPSRREVHDLTRRVEELSRRIDGFRRARRGRTATRARR